MGNRKPIHRRAGLVAIAVLAAMTATSCIWANPRGGSGLAYQAVSTIHSDDLSALATAWTATIDGAPWTPVIDGEVAVVASGTKLRAFDAHGCGAATCPPVWEATNAFAFGQPVIDGRIVYVVVHGVLQAYDAAGSTNCGGAPVICSPLWTANTAGDRVGAGGGVVVVTGGSQGYVYQAGDGSSATCTGAPRTCAPLRVLDGLCLGLVPTLPGEACTSSTASIGDGLIAIGSTTDDVIVETRPGNLSHSGGVFIFYLNGFGCPEAPPSGPPVCTAARGASNGSVSSAPAIHDGVVSYASHGAYTDTTTSGTEHYGGLFTFDPETGGFPLWVADATTHLVDGQLVVGGDTIYELFGNNVRAISASSGTVHWATSLPEAGVEISGAADVIYVTLASGVVDTLDAVSGQISDHGLSATALVSISNNRLWLARTGQLRVLERTST